MIYDVIISGAGMAGRLLGLALVRQGLRVILVEKGEAMLADNRTSAISRSSRGVLEGLGLWQALEPYSCPINDILISAEAPGSAFVHYDNELVRGLPMGYTVPNRCLKQALQLDCLEILQAEECRDFLETNSAVEVFLKSGSSLKGKVMVLAEGKNSALAKKLHLKIRSYDYQQSCIISTVKHELDHRNIAIELFCPNGPFALLPTKDNHSSALIWTEASAAIDAVMRLETQAVLALLNTRTNLKITDFEPLVSYPVSLRFATEYSRGKVVIFGDALHSIHPVAGQGLNLIISDVKAFVESLPLGLGSELMFDHFRRSRLVDNFAMIAMTHFLVRIFSKKSGVVNFFRNLGMALLNESDCLKQFFIRRAMGI